MSLIMKYFVLKPAGDDIFARASRKAMRAYAGVIEAHDKELAYELREWASQEHAESYARSMESDDSLNTT